MPSVSASASPTQDQNLLLSASQRGHDVATASRPPLSPRPHQIEAAAALDHAIWNEEGPALGVAPVAAGKTLILCMVAVMAVERGCDRVVIPSRARHIAEHGRDTLRLYRPNITAGLYTGAKKQTAQILFATAQTLARHIDVVEAADLVLIDECDQAYLRDKTKEYKAILKAAQRYAGVTGTPFVLEKGRIVLEKGRTVPIFGPGKIFNKPCSLVTKADLRDAGFFHFIEPAPITPSRQLKIDRQTKVDLSGDFDTKVQACSAPMLSAIAEDTKAAVNLLPAGQRVLFFGTTTDQCDAQVEAYKVVGLNVEPYHNNMTAAAQDSIIGRFRAGEIQGLCTVSKVNRGFDCPAVSLVVIGFGTASRAKFEQMCGRAQRVFEGKTAAWVLDYGGHGQRFGSANWDWPAAIEFDRREKLRLPAAKLAGLIVVDRHDPKCEVRPDNFMDLSEATIDLFDVVVKRSRNGKGVRLFYVHGLGYTEQYVHANTEWTARFSAFFRCARISNICSPTLRWRRTFQSSQRGGPAISYHAAACPRRLS